MSKKEETTTQGIGLLGAVFLVFLTLKLLGEITWSWMWVTAPLWGVIGLVAAVVVGLIPIFLVMSLFDLARNKQIRKSRSK